MAGAYSTDLRDRVLVAVEAGEPADAVAEAFMVGRSSVYRWLAAARDEGRRTPKPMGGGPKPIIRGEVAVTLRHLLAANNHLTRVLQFELATRWNYSKIRPYACIVVLKSFRLVARSQLK